MQEYSATLRVEIDGVPYRVNLTHDLDGGRMFVYRETDNELVAASCPAPHLDVKAVEQTIKELLAD